MTTAPARVSVAPPQAAVREAGLLRPRTGHYAAEFLSTTVLMAVAGGLFRQLGDSWTRTS